MPVKKLASGKTVVVPQQSGSTVTSCPSWFFGGPHHWPATGIADCIKRRKKFFGYGTWYTYSHEWDKETRRCKYCDKTRVELKVKPTPEDVCGYCGVTRRNAFHQAQAGRQPTLHCEEFGHVVHRGRSRPGFIDLSQRIAQDQQQRHQSQRASSVSSLNKETPMSIVVIKPHLQAWSPDDPKTCLPSILKSKGHNTYARIFREILQEMKITPKQWEVLMSERQKREALATDRERELLRTELTIKFARDRMTAKTFMEAMRFLEPAVLSPARVAALAAANEESRKRSANAR